MIEHATNDDKLLQALDAMEVDPQLTEEEWQNVLQDEEILQVCRDIQHTSFVLSMDNQHQKGIFDVEKELNAFKHKKQAKQSKNFRIYLQMVAGIAAMIALCWMGYYLTDWWMTQQSHSKQMVQVFEADTLPQKVLLDKGDGQQMVLNTHEACLPPVSSKTSGAAGARVTMEETLPPHKLTIPRGETFKLTLCDGTEVWLNANSYFVYPTAFVGKERVVSLEGEAYFKVAKDESRPFIVKTPHVQTRVLGTEFNLRSYTPEDTHVVLIDGKVEVCNTKGNAYTALIPGEDAHLQSDGNFVMTEVDLDSYIYWKDGYFYFDNENLKEIMENIGRWYNVNIVFRNAEAMKHTMHFVANRNKSLEYTLNLLNRMKKVTATIQGNTVIID